MDSTNSTVKTPEEESKTPPAKLLTFINGSLHLHGGGNIHHHHHNHHPVVVTYGECLKNHAAGIGGHAVDGCGEFMPSSTSCNSEPASFKCAACGCHRNFHRRDPEEPPVVGNNAVPVLGFQTHHRHQLPSPLQPRDSADSPGNSPSPPPISSSFYHSAPHTLIALSHGLSTPPPETNISFSTAGRKTISATPQSNPTSRKRFRTKFTQDQKQKMQDFSDKLGWKLQKKDDDIIHSFCAEIGVEKAVLKVWMHNNKNNSNKKDNPAAQYNNTDNPSAAATAAANGENIVYNTEFAATNSPQLDDDSEMTIIHSRREMNQHQLQD